MPHHVRVFTVCAFGFVLLGMGTSSFGVVWPSVADELGRSIGELGYVTLAYGAGYTASSVLNGRLVARSSIGALLIWAAVVAAVALATLASAPGWISFLLAAATLGVAGGQIDAATNTYVAVRHGPRAMGLVHAAFGVGTFIGPLLVTALLFWGLSWRIAFAVLAIGQVVYGAGLWFFARPLIVSTGATPTRLAASHPRSATLVWSVAVFFLYAGLATGLGTWTFAYLTEERGLSDTTGGLVVTAYWVGFTISRLILGAVGDRVDSTRLLRWSVAATTVGVAVFWLSPVMWMVIFALVLLGFAHGPIFPLEMVLTAERFGASLAAAVVGFEIAAANVGAALIPGSIGLFVDRFGLASVPPVLLVAALLVWVAIEGLRLASARAVARRTG